MPARIVVFGATGYTGRKTAEALVARGERPVLAGRNPERLASLAADLGGLETAVADVAQPQTVNEIVARGDVLVATVGPFVRFGRPAVEAAIDRGAHYLDSTGEPRFIREVFEHYGPAGARAGVGLLTAMGYDWVPGNLAGALALERAGAAAVRVDTGYFITGDASVGGMSGGTRASTAANLAEKAFAWREGRIVTERSLRRVRTFTVDGAELQAVSVGTSEHFGLPRFAPQLREVNAYLGWFGKLSRPMQAFSAVGAAITAVPGARSLMDAVTSRLVTGLDRRARTKRSWPEAGPTSSRSRTTRVAASSPRCTSREWIRTPSRPASWRGLPRRSRPTACARPGHSRPWRRSGCATSRTASPTPASPSASERSRCCLLAGLRASGSAR